MHLFKRIVSLPIDVLFEGMVNGNVGRLPTSCMYIQKSDDFSDSHKLTLGSVTQATLSLAEQKFLNRKFINEEVITWEPLWVDNDGKNVFPKCNESLKKSVQFGNINKSLI